MFKTYPARIKAAGAEDGLAEGQFRALVSVFNVKDSMGDVIVPGAFTDTLEEWKASGDSIPVYWSHQMHDPDYNVGWVLDAEQTGEGLEVLAQLDLEEGGSPKARQVYRLLKGRRVTQFSFAYDVTDGGPSKSDDHGDHNELRILKLYEVGPTPIGANQETDLLGVKDAVALLKRGRVLSSKNETALTDALAAITAGVTSIKSVLSAVGTADEEDDGGKAATPHQDKANGTGPVTPQEPPRGATGQEPNRTSPVALLAAHLQLLEHEG